jgi:hypothetical protein
VDDDTQAWTEVLQRMSNWLGLRLGLGTSAEKEVWQFIIGAAAHLEDLAVTVLWLEEGAPGNALAWRRALGRNRQADWSLGSAAWELERRSMALPETIRRLKAIADLRNAVTHRGATDGVPWVAEYEGRPVFRDLDALRKLEEDVNRTTEELRSLI